MAQGRDAGEVQRSADAAGGSRRGAVGARSGAASGRARNLPATAAAYAAERFPLWPLATALVLAYGCAYGVCSLASGTAEVSVRTFLGGLTFVGVFFGIRVIDDIDDYPEDAAAGRRLAAIVDRGELLAILTVVVVALVVLNLGAPAAGAVALLTLLLNTFATFVVKARLTQQPVVLALVYETAPLLAVWSITVQWSEVTGERLPAAESWAIAVYFLLLFEVWKFTRKIGEDVFQPYALGPVGLRRAVLGLLAAFVATHLALAPVADWSVGYLAFGCGIGVAVAVWVVRAWPRSWGSGSPLQLSGLLLAGLVDLGLIVEMAVRAG